MCIMAPKKYRKTYQKKSGMEKAARKAVKQAIHAEIEDKIWDGSVALAGANVDYTGVVYGMFSDVPTASTIVQGANISQYIGQKVTPTSIEIRYCWINTLADTTNLCTVIVFQSIGSFAPTGGVMTNVLQSTANFSAPLSPLDLSYDNRFRVLYRKVVDLSQSGQDIVQHTVFIKRKNLRQVHFSDGAGSYESQGLYIGFISDSSVAVHPLVRCQWRIRYEDA